METSEWSTSRPGLFTHCRVKKTAKDVENKQRKKWKKYSEKEMQSRKSEKNFNNQMHAEYVKINLYYKNVY